MDTNIAFEKLKRKYRRLTTIFILIMLCLATSIGYIIYQRNLPDALVTSEWFNHSILSKQTSLTVEEVIHSEELLNLYTICERLVKISKEELIVDLPNRRVYTKSKDACVHYFHIKGDVTLRVTPDGIWTMTYDNGQEETVTNKALEMERDGFDNNIIIVPNNVLIENATGYAQIMNMRDMDR